MENLNHENQPNGHVVIEDELTIYTAQDLKDKLLAALSMTDELELDMFGVSEIDGAGLQLLVMIKQESAALGKALRFTGHSPAVLDLLDLSGLAGFFGDPLLIVYKSSQ